MVIIAINALEWNFTVAPNPGAQLYKPSLISAVSSGYKTTALVSRQSVPLRDQFKDRHDCLLRSSVAGSNKEPDIVNDTNLRHT